MSLLPSTATASEPLLDGMWIRMNVTGNGFSIEDVDNTKRKAGTFQSVCYMLLSYIDPVAEPPAEDPPAYYEGQIVCQTALNVWERVDRIEFRRLLSDSTPTGFAGGATVADWHVGFTNSKGQRISGYGSHLLLPVITAKGVLRSVSLRSWGEIIGGTLAPGVSAFLGGYQVRGISIAASKVPEAVVAAMPVTRWSDGTNVWPDQACNPELSFGSCDTNDQDHANAWATWVCQQNGFESGAWTRSKIAGCSGEISMYCNNGSIPCEPLIEDFCQPGDQTQIQFTCFP